MYENSQYGFSEPDHTVNEGWRAVPDGNRSECRDLTPPAVIEQTAQKTRSAPRTAQLVHHFTVLCPSVVCDYYLTLSPSFRLRTGRARSTHRPTWVSRHLGSKR